jgi:hypothetical protein
MLTLLRHAQGITWIQVQKPTFDLVGVVLYSLGLAGICAAVAAVLGIALGVGFILRARRHPPEPISERGLHLLEARRP